MKNSDTNLHVRGLSQFIDDRAAPDGTLYAAIYDSPHAFANIKSINLDKAKASDGVTSIITAADIPGENQIGNIIQDEVLLAERQVHYMGQPIAIVIAESARKARLAVSKITAQFEILQPVTDARIAAQKSLMIAPPRTFQFGDTENAFKKCSYIFEGKVESGGQEHLYLEMQGAIAIPKEDSKMLVISSTQGPTAVQRAISKVLGTAMNKIEVDVLRLGGGFGGKEDQATPWACMAALAAHNLKRPVKLVLRRHEDMRMTGKRHPYQSDFKIGLNKKLKVLAYEATFFQNAGASADLSTAVLERTLFHVTNSYFIPNAKVTAYSCKTNLPPNTAFRGFGGPQGMFVIESAITKAAFGLKIKPATIQKANLLKDGNVFPYGQKVKKSRAIACWSDAEKRYNLKKLQKKVATFNKENVWQKKGLAVMPICFGISFTATFMNQASALVHIYCDGSVGLSTAAVEMGQGVNMKLRQVVADIFSINIDHVFMETTNTSRIANTSPTAASAAADLNGHATRIACTNILDRLKQNAAQLIGKKDPDKVNIKKEIVYFNNNKSKLNWQKLISETYLKRISLSAHAHYATPKIHFDKTKEKGMPFAYHSYGMAMVEATVDCLRGTYHIDAVHATHDFGKSLNKIVDLGQAEGGIVQGLGWMLLEEIQYDKQGKLQTANLSTYKVPDIYFAPNEINVHFLKNPFSSAAIFNSKAIGEPPLMYGIGGYFAVLDALKAFKPDLNPDFTAPLTHERALRLIHHL